MSQLTEEQRNTLVQLRRALPARRVVPIRRHSLKWVSLAYGTATLSGNLTSMGALCFAISSRAM